MIQRKSKQSDLVLTVELKTENLIYARYNYTTDGKEYFTVELNPNLEKQEVRIPSSALMRMQSGQLYNKVQEGYKDTFFEDQIDNKEYIYYLDIWLLSEGESENENTNCGPVDAVKWGQIGGVITNQLDLQEALSNAKGSIALVSVNEAGSIVYGSVESLIEAYKKNEAYMLRLIVNEAEYGQIYAVYSDIDGNQSLKALFECNDDYYEIDYNFEDGSFSVIKKYEGERVVIIDLDKVDERDYYLPRYNAVYDALYNNTGNVIAFKSTGHSYSKMVSNRVYIEAHHIVATFQDWTNKKLYGYLFDANGIISFAEHTYKDWFGYCAKEEIDEDLNRIESIVIVESPSNTIRGDIDKLVEDCINGKPVEIRYETEGVVYCPCSMEYLSDDSAIKASFIIPNDLYDRELELYYYIDRKSIGYSSDNIGTRCISLNLDNTDYSYFHPNFSAICDALDGENDSLKDKPIIVRKRFEYDTGVATYVNASSLSKIDGGFIAVFSDYVNQKVVFLNVQENGIAGEETASLSEIGNYYEKEYIDEQINELQSSIGDIDTALTLIIGA